MRIIDLPYRSIRRVDLSDVNETERQAENQSCTCHELLLFFSPQRGLDEKRERDSGSGSSTLTQWRSNDADLAVAARAEGLRRTPSRSSIVSIRCPGISSELPVLDESAGSEPIFLTTSELRVHSRGQLTLDTTR